MCDLVARWQIHPVLAARILDMLRPEVGPFGYLGLSIISGARSRSDQARLEAEGRPAAPFDLSTHANEDASGCPRLATGADLRPGVESVRTVQAQFGYAALLSFLRWGGGSPIDPETGIPSDWNHVDLGPRSEFP